MRSVFYWLFDGFDMTETERRTGEVLFWLDACAR